MAEVLIKLGHAETIVDQANAWARLHPVCVFPDGHKWGTEERPPKFVVVRVVDMTVDELRPYLMPSIDITDPERPVITAIRKWKVDIDDISIARETMKAIAAGGILEVTKAQVTTIIRRVAL